jgi:hypothetical protein
VDGGPCNVEVSTAADSRCGTLGSSIRSRRRWSVYALGRGGWSEVESYRGDALVRAAPFDAIELDLSVLWA